MKNSGNIQKEQNKSAYDVENKRESSFGTFVTEVSGSLKNLDEYLWEALDASLPHEMFELVISVDSTSSVNFIVCSPLSHSEVSNWSSKFVSQELGDVTLMDSIVTSLGHRTCSDQSLDYRKELSYRENCPCC